MERLTHLSLFSGIGGLDLAAEWAGFETVGQCEWADYPRSVLEKHWPDVPKWRDVHDLTADEFFRRTGCQPGGVTCISGGFPCQPHSIAGKRKASSDERDLWPEYRRIISEIKPRWIVAENVRGLLSSENGRFFRGILRDLSDLGYDVGWCCFRAADIGAIHPRERVGVVAHTGCKRIVEQQIKKHTAERNKTQHGFDRNPSCDGVSEEDEWAEMCNVFEPKLLRDVNGIPNRVDRLKCLGNAVVPQQFYPIFKAIADIEGGMI